MIDLIQFSIYLPWFIFVCIGFRKHRRSCTIQGGSRVYLVQERRGQGLCQNPNPWRLRLWRSGPKSHFCNWSHIREIWSPSPLIPCQRNKMSKGNYMHTNTPTWIAVTNYLDTGSVLFFGYLVALFLIPNEYFAYPKWYFACRSFAFAFQK